MTPLRLVRAAMNVGVVAGSAVFMASNGPALIGAVGRAHHLELAPLLLGLVCAGLAMLNRAGGARAAHRSVGLTVPTWSMLRPTMTAFAADKVIRAGGLSGLAVMARHGDQSGYPKGSVIASTLVAKATSFASLGICLLASVLTLAHTDELTGWWLAAALGFAIYAIAAGVIGVGFAKYRSVAQRWWTRLERRAPRLCRWFAGSDPVGTIAHGMGATRRHPYLVAQVLAHALLGKVLGAAMLFAAAAAVGAPLTQASVLIIYSTVLLSSIASVTPGGIGAVEASATAVLLGAGSDVGDALLTIALFRVFDLWLPLIVGAVASRRRHKGTDRSMTRDVPSADVLHLHRPPVEPHRVRRCRDAHGGCTTAGRRDKPEIAYLSTGSPRMLDQPAASTTCPARPSTLFYAPEDDDTNTAEPSTSRFWSRDGDPPRDRGLDDERSARV